MKNIFTKKHNTKNLILGIPEAEMEANFNARVKLTDVFDDYLEVLPELETEKFIVTGRKGSGKSAIGQMIKKNSKNDPNKFCEFIQKADIDLESIVQISENTGNPIQIELLFKWIILTRMLKLICENQALQHLRDIKIINHFLAKNTGFVNIDKYEIKEILTTSGFEIFIEKILRYARFKKSKEIKLTGTKAPFYKLIPHLEEIVVNLLTDYSELVNNNSYKIIFDDLDIEFKSENKKDVDTLLNLIRISKNYNNNLFADNEINAKVIILLRDDITEVLIKKSADMSKVFRSSSICLTWFEHEMYKVDENLTLLKKFINKRILKAFEKKGIDSTGDPWNMLVENSIDYNESSFKYVIDHTFYTPRDLILFFQGIEKYEFPLPLEFAQVNNLIGKYSIKVRGEIQNALAIHYNEDDIDNILTLLRELSKLNDSYSYEEFKKIHDELEISTKPYRTSEILFDYSIIGNKNPNNSMVYFRHRENEEDHYSLDIDKPLVSHRILKILSKNQKN